MEEKKSLALSMVQPKYIASYSLHKLHELLVKRRLEILIMDSELSDILDTNIENLRKTVDFYNETELKSMSVNMNKDSCDRMARIDLQIRQVFIGLFCNVELIEQHSGYPNKNKHFSDRMATIAELSGVTGPFDSRIRETIMPLRHNGKPDTSDRMATITRLPVLCYSCFCKSIPASRRSQILLADLRLGDVSMDIGLFDGMLIITKIPRPIKQRVARNEEKEAIFGRINSTPNMMVCTHY